jgi:deazaflavin-dependent oxidoreductase (nitroreductase family)
MKSLFRVLMSVFSWVYRVSNGSIMGRMAGLDVLLLTTAGRKTGKSRTTPLGFFEQDNAYVIIASNGGSDKHPDWFFNLQTNPHVTVRVRDKEMRATAEVTSGQPRKDLWQKLVRLSPQYEHYTRNTKRQIPVILLRPVA